MGELGGWLGLRVRGAHRNLDLWREGSLLSPLVPVRPCSCLWSCHTLATNARGGIGFGSEGEIQRTGSTPILELVAKKFKHGAQLQDHCTRTTEACARPCSCME